MGIASFITDKILDPFIETHAIAPRMAAREAERQERLEKERQARETELRLERQLREAKLYAKEMELQARTARLDAAEEMHRRIQFNNEMWAGWIARRDAAMAQGLEFNEPRPDGARN